MNKNNQTLKETFAKALESYKKRDFKNAEIYCYKILSIDPNHLDSMSLLANIAAISKNFNKAIELLNKLVQIHPNNIIAIHNLGSAYKDLGKLDEAIKYYKKVLEKEPLHTNAHYNLGMVFYKLGDLNPQTNSPNEKYTDRNLSCINPNNRFTIC